MIVSLVCGVYLSNISGFVCTYWDFITQEVKTEALRCLRCTSNLEDLASADIVIEAIVESEDVKKSLFVQLDKIVKKSAILASNTSSISITRLAAATGRPQQVNFDYFSKFLFMFNVRTEFVLVWYM